MNQTKKKTRSGAVGRHLGLLCLTLLAAAACATATAPAPERRTAPGPVDRDFESPIVWTPRLAPRAVYSAPVAAPAAPVPADVRVEARTPQVKIVVPETVRNPALDEYPIALDVAAERDGRPDSAGMGRLTAALEEKLLSSGLRVVPVSPGAALRPGDADYLVRWTVGFHREMELGAGRMLVSGRGDLEVIRVDGGEPLGRAAHDVTSGADSTEEDALAEVAGKLAERARAKVLAVVRDHAKTIREKVVEISADDAELPLRELCDPLLQALMEEEGLFDVTYTAGPAMDGGRRARIAVRMTPEYEGDLAETVRRALEKDGPATRFRVGTGGAR